ncbi:hypothetical protein BG003_002442 [Podila horticola]|nr:hypothetical protein BG003_002442 [Podila horticola]
MKFFVVLDTFLILETRSRHKDAVVTTIYVKINGNNYTADGQANPKVVHRGNFGSQDANATPHECGELITFECDPDDTIEIGMIVENSSNPDTGIYEALLNVAGGAAQIAGALAVSAATPLGVVGGATAIVAGAVSSFLPSIANCDGIVAADFVIMKAKDMDAHLTSIGGNDQEIEKIYPVRSGLYRCTTVWSIGSGYVAQVPVSAFLVRHDNNPYDWSLIDTCGPDESSILVNAIDELLTRTQDRIRKVVVHVEEKPFVCDGRQLKSCSGDTWTFTLLKVPMDYLHEAKVRAPSDRTVTLRDGDHWEFGYVLEFVETPGHTPGSASFIHVPSRSLMVGDAVMNYPKRLRTHTSIDLSLGNAMKAIDKILSRDDRVVTVFPSRDVGQSGIHIAKVRDFHCPS